MVRLVALLLLSAVVLSCAVSPVTGRRELMLLDEAQELELGRRLYPQALWGELSGGGIYRDPRLTAYLEGMVMRLHAVSHRPHLPLKFVIHNSSVPNAWALPGYVAITRGLVSALRNEAQFAFIMGHELGHVAARHSARQYSRGLLGELLLGLGAVFTEAEPWMLNLAALGTGLFMLKYSRSEELEADRLGVLYMARAGYRPQEAGQAHRVLLQAVQAYRQRMDLESTEAGVLDELLSTHPRTEVRLQTVREAMAQVGEFRPHGDGVNEERFLAMTASLRRIQKAYEHYDKALGLYRKDRLDAAQEALRQALAIDARQAPFYTLKGLILTQKGLYGAAELAFKEALSLDAQYQPAWQAKGFFHYRTGTYQRAIQALERALQFYPQSVVSHFLKGLSHYRLGQCRQAVPHLEVAGRALPRDGQVHGTLGICYERLGRLREAYREYRHQVEVAPFTELGRHARARLAVLGPLLYPR